MPLMWQQITVDPILARRPGVTSHKSARRMGRAESKHIEMHW